MKNNYLKYLALFGLTFLTGAVFAQNSLKNSKYSNQVTKHLNQKKAAYKLADSDLIDLQVSNEFFSKKSKVTHIYLQQQFRGVKIYNAISNMAVKNNDVIHYANGFISNISKRAKALNPSINGEQAIHKFASAYKLGVVHNLKLLNSKKNSFEYNTGGISKDNILVELVYFQNTDGDLKLAWNLSIHTLDALHYWSARIDAVTGEMLDVSDLVVSCEFGSAQHKEHKNLNYSTIKNSSFNLHKKNNSLFLADGSQYNVFALPTESPIHGSISLVSNPANLTASPFGWHDTDGVSGAESALTIGNNVIAYEDTSNTESGDEANGTAALNFNFPFTPNEHPFNYKDLSITNLFYTTNVMHDIWYQYGFDEASGNFQVNNFNNGGLGGDVLHAQAQDGGKVNNANMLTLPEGMSPKMQMYLYTPASYPTQFLKVNAPISLKGNYDSTTALFGPSLYWNNVSATANLAIANTLNLNATTASEACTPIANDLTGKIAVIRRGGCDFTTKVQNAQDAGAVGVIVVNNVENQPIYTMNGTTSKIRIPSVLMPKATGDALIAVLNSGGTLNATLINTGSKLIDGALDNGIVAHEYGHGISTRLVGGAGVTTCLMNPEQMGEGWSDWFALMLTMKSGDSGTDLRTIGSYALNQNVNGTGLRPAPYSTAFSANDYTYNATNDTTPIGETLGIPIPWNEIHNLGFVWATMLWDLTWAYVDKYGFDTDFYDGTGGNNKVMQLVIDGLKLTPCSPGFIDGRDAILAADMALTGGENQCMIWQVFAARGLGYGASQGLSNSATDQVEDFTIPTAIDLGDGSLNTCTSLSTSMLKLNNYKIYPNPTNSTLIIKTIKSYGEVSLTLTDVNGRIMVSRKANSSNEIKLNLRNLNSGIYVLNIKGQNFSVNEKIIKN